jgi:4-amino-4-deoxy-L-arabinose transferase-like glycosyltransferase
MHDPSPDPGRQAPTPPSSPRPAPRWIGAWIPALLCLTINGAILAGIWLENPDYLADSGSNKNPDALHYVLLGRNALQHGEFSRSDAPPYIPDMLRTPAYPLFAGGLDLCGKAAAIYVMQALLQVTSCLLAYALAARHFGPAAGGFAALLVATDLMWAISNFEAMSEPLFVFLILLSLDQWSRAITRGRSGPAMWGALCVSGLILGAAILTRPVALYITPIMFLYLLTDRSVEPRMRSRLGGACLVMAAALVLPAAWAWRNYRIFSVPKLTYVDTINLVYFAGAGGYQVERGLDLEAAQRAISEEYGLAPYREAQNAQNSGYSPAEIEGQLRGAWPRVILRYPKAFVSSCILALVKAEISHNVPILADITGQSWIPPRAEDLIQLRSNSFRRLAQNPLPLAAAFSWELIHTLIALGAALLGIVLMVREPSRQPITLFFLTILGYFLLTICLFGLEAYYRCRLPSLPLLYIFAGGGIGRAAAPWRPGG